MSGARIVLHLALELQRRGGGIGAAALCGGGGQGDALIVRVPQRDAGRAEPTPRRRHVGGVGAASTSPTSSSGPATGEPRAVARLISLVEDASPLLREVMAGAGAAHRPRAGRRHHRLARASASRPRRRRWSRALRARRQAGRRARRRPVVAVLRRRAARRPGPDAGPRHRPRRLHPLDGLAAATSAGWPGRPRRRCGCSTPPAATWSWSRPSASGQTEVEIAGLADTTLVLLAPGMGDGIQAAKAGHPRDRRRVRRQQGRPGRRRPGRAATCATCSPSATAPTGAWRPPIVQTVAQTGRGRRRGGRGDRRAPRVARGVRRARPAPRTRRARDEIEAIAVTALRERWTELHERTELDAAGRPGRRGGDRPVRRRGRAAGDVRRGHGTPDRGRRDRAGAPPTPGHVALR